MDKIAFGLEADGILTGAGKKNGGPVPSTKFCVMKNIWVMPYFRKHTPLIFLTKQE